MTINSSLLLSKAFIMVTRMQYSAFVGVGPNMVVLRRPCALLGRPLTTTRWAAGTRATFSPRLPQYATLASPRVDTADDSPVSATTPTATADGVRRSRTGTDLRADGVAEILDAAEGDLVVPDVLAELESVGAQSSPGANGLGSLSRGNEQLLAFSSDLSDEMSSATIVDEDIVEDDVPGDRVSKGRLGSEGQKAFLDISGTSRTNAVAETAAPKKKIVDGMGPALTEFRLSKVTLERLAKNGITLATEVQAGTFNTIYDGKDLIAKSRTGTGKTLAFALPIMERLAILRKEVPKGRGQGPGIIVLAPTRELAKQVAREMTYIGDGLDLSVECFYGGVGYGPQENALRRSVDIVVGTPGRIIDHITRGTLRLNSVSFAVLDEADEMLSMGFAQDVETVFAGLPPQDERQVILFSATVPAWVKSLASQYQQKDVVTFDAISRGTSLAATTVRHCAVRVPERDEARADLLADIIAVYSNSAEGSGPSRAMVFCQTKREADELATSGALDGCGAAVLHGDVSQKQREVTLSQFRKGKFQVLVATDVAARGLDISGVDVVVQYRVPQDSEAYIHRSGRTGRAGKTGTAVVMYNDREQNSIRQLERSCKIQFDREAAPAPELALEAAADVAVSSMSSVDARVISHLLPRAEKMLAEAENPAMVFATILAIAGRRIDLPDRSVLSGESGMRTLLVKGTEEVSPGLALRFIGELSRRIGCDERVGLIRLCRNGSAVVDVPSDAAEAIVNGARDRSIVQSQELTVEFAPSIPALKDDDRRGYGSRGGRDRGRSGGGGGRRSYGDRQSFDSYGRSGGGGYSRDSFSRDGGYGRGGGGGGGYSRDGGGGGGGGYSRDGGRSSSYSRDGGYGSSRGSPGRRGGGSRSFQDSRGDSNGSYRDDGGRRGRSSDGGGRSGRRSPELLSEDF